MHYVLMFVLSILKMQLCKGKKVPSQIALNGSYLHEMNNECRTYYSLIIGMFIYFHYHTHFLKQLI